MDNFVIFSKACLILELMLCNRNFLYTNFVKFEFQIMSSIIELAFEKMTKYIFVFILPTPT